MLDTAKTELARPQGVNSMTDAKLATGLFGLTEECPRARPHCDMDPDLFCHYMVDLPVTTGHGPILLKNNL